MRDWPNCRNFFAAMLSLGLVCGCAGSRQEQGLSRLDKQLVETTKALNETTLKLEAIRNDVMILQDQMESTRLEVQQLQHHNRVVPKSVLVAKAAIPAAPKSSTPLIAIASSEKPGPASVRATDAMQSYRRAFALYETNKLNDAIEQFEDFVKKNPSHDYADNAIYWMGEAYYDQKEYLLAIGEFQRLMRTYPNSNKVADTWLKMGMCFERLEDSGAAGSAYKKVVENYSYTEAAKMANERLAKLSNQKQR